MARGDTDDTVLVYVYGERVQLDAERPAAYLKLVAGAPREQYVAYREDNQLVGLADTVTVAPYVDDGRSISFQSQDRLTKVIGESAAADRPRTTIYVNGQPVMVETATTVADLRTAAGMPEHTVAMVRDHDAGQVYTLTEDEPILESVQPGGAIAFRGEPGQ